MYSQFKSSMAYPKGSATKKKTLTFALQMSNHRAYYQVSIPTRDSQKPSSCRKKVKRPYSATYKRFRTHDKSWLVIIAGVLNHLRSIQHARGPSMHICKIWLSHVRSLIDADDLDRAEEQHRFYHQYTTDGIRPSACHEGCSFNEFLAYNTIPDPDCPNMSHSLRSAQRFDIIQDDEEWQTIPATASEIAVDVSKMLAAEKFRTTINELYPTVLDKDIKKLVMSNDGAELAKMDRRQVITYQINIIHSRYFYCQLGLVNGLVDANQFEAAWVLLRHYGRLYAHASILNPKWMRFVVILNDLARLIYLRQGFELNWEGADKGYHCLLDEF